MKCVIVCLFIAGFTCASAQTKSSRQYVSTTDVEPEVFLMMHAIEQEIMRLNGIELTSSHVNHILLALLNAGAEGVSEMGHSIEHVLEVLVDCQQQAICVQKGKSVCLSSDCQQVHQKYILICADKTISFDLIFGELNSKACLLTMCLKQSEKTVAKR